ncbi:MAG: hypothetical protein QM446_06860 [Synergistota bacterium]|nr:hypothetical protein [Synergistota bacterium]
MDENWKEIIKQFFRQALEKFIPELAEDLDTSREVTFLDKELQDLVVYVDGPEQIPDILARVPTKTGHDVWLILHVEIQGPGGGDLPERMFFYNSSLRVLHLKKRGDVSDVVSFALLTAKRPGDEAERYLRESYRNRLVYEYPSLRLWELDSSELQSSDNPFDWVLQAGKCALEGGRNERVKLDYLESVIDKLDAKGWSHDEKLALLRFTDALLHPKDPQLRKEYDSFREQRSKEGKPMLISVVEERAIERGKEIGKEIGEKIGEKRGEKEKAFAVASRMLASNEPKEKILDYTGISPEELDDLIASRKN